MAEQSMQEESALTKEFVTLLKELKPFFDLIAEAAYADGQMYLLSLRAAFVKAYEFNMLAWDDSAAKRAYFWIPSLRGICEDFIVLRYLVGVPHEDREALVAGLAAYEAHQRLKTQQQFFSSVRDFQTVLRPIMTPEQVADTEGKIRTLWRANGFPKMSRGVLPPTQQLAAKVGGGVLVSVYEYLYRLASSSVHFSVHGLLRMGWGTLNQDGEVVNGSFSAQHFAGYFKMFGRIYGAFILCAYCESFWDQFAEAGDPNVTVDKIRKAILSVRRWPEMLTFEEMNVPYPMNGLFEQAMAIMQAEKADRLLSLKGGLSVGECAE